MDPCKVCAMTKIRNQTNTYVFKRKANLFNLVLINICGPLPVVFSGAYYFLKAVDNHT
jgi:hypothetical protein